jgi:para-aminobenzoate synthetase component 1
MPSIKLRRFAWRDPLDVAAHHAERDFAALLLSDGGPEARWSYLVLEPETVVSLPSGAGAAVGDALRRLLAGPATRIDGGPPFQGGVVGLLAYEAGDAGQGLELARDPDWPDEVLARARSLLAFDHHAREVVAVGSGADDDEAGQAMARAGAWLDAGVASADGAPQTVCGPRLGRPDEPGDDEAGFGSFAPERSGAAYEAAVASTVERIGLGELYQANIARAWGGTLASGVAPFDVFRRLVSVSPAPFSAYLRLPGRALISHSPERFVRVGPDGRTVETRPIKGTRPRHADPDRDAALARALVESAKDRAENLMIVDLMRNDLGRVCAPGSVEVSGLCELESFPHVHHLVSTVHGRLAPGRDAADLLAATFPPGSITGAPKRAAMQRIAALEPPRGPWCGSLFWSGWDGAMDSSVLIRTAALVQTPGGGWRFRACAGAGIVADSDPGAERAETEDKIAGLRRAFTGRS